MVAINKGLKEIHVAHDAILSIATASNRKSKHWKNSVVSWSKLLSRLSDCRRTGETMSEYRKMSKDRQDDIKDIGGFVGGVLTGGRRCASSVEGRQLITLDADYAGTDFWDIVEMFTDYACCVYSTHKHTEDSPRLRLVIPVDRLVTVDEYQAIARKLAEDIGIDRFDDTTYEAHRLMYYPSASLDGPVVFKYRDCSILKADTVLARYEDWTDQASWPVSSRVDHIISKAMKKQEDPLEKHGIVGLFCRAYSVPEVIDEYLSDVYEPCKDGRYTFKAGSTTGGAVVYEDKFLYSHHATDPCSMQLCNAFDLVRLQKFSELDDGKSTDSPTKLPSYTAMCKLASKDDNVKILIAKEKRAEAGDDFEVIPDDDGEADMSWTAKLKLNEKTGEILGTRFNIRIILENDPSIKGCFGYDLFAGRIAVLEKPKWRCLDDNDPHWNDSDDSELRYMMETVYGIDNRAKIEDEIINVSKRKAFHRVREYLRSLKWDGVKRLDTVFIDYLGAEDTAYTRMVTRKTLIAAVARVQEPGVKFDNMVVLEGPQGIGKSYLLKRLGKKWFSDSLTGVQGKDAYEQLRGCWIIEMGELAALKKSEVEATKLFISKQSDIYRVPYGRRLSEFPRQCIFIGTTNDAVFLQDKTGNRRFFPIAVRKKNPVLWSKEMESNVDQIWAEALEAYKKKESLWIGEEMEQEAKKVQKAFTEEDTLLGMIQEFVKVRIPKNWYQLDLPTRQNYFRGTAFEVDEEDSMERTRISPIEVWCELLGNKPSDFPNYKRKEIRGALDQLKEFHLYKNGQRHVSFGRAYGQQRSYITEKDTAFTEEENIKEMLS